MKPASFWHQLAKPIIGLSPMDGVTDQPFRHIQKKYGRPAVIYTEFTSVEGVCHGADRLLVDFLYDEIQRPVIAQIYGTTPDSFRQTAILLCELGFDGIDINMGCPAKNVAHSGAGAALIRTPELARQIIQATKRGIDQWQQGAGQADCPQITPEIWVEVQRRKALLPAEYQTKRHIPVSVKTRIGFDQPSVTDWIPTLLSEEVEAIALHGRTLKQRYTGQADWEEIGKAATLAHQTGTLLLGNGDIKNLDEAYEKVSTYGVDGVLIGRAAWGDPLVFQPEPKDQVSPFKIAVEHTKVYEQTFQGDEKYHFLPMRKHLGWYVRDIPNASQIRIDLFKASSSQEVEQVLQGYQLL
jgi:tRNA-dihydrouridine synthase B